MRLKLLVPRAFNGVPVADVGGSGEVWGDVRVSPLPGSAPCAGSVQVVTCHPRVPIGRSGTSTSWAWWRWTTRGRATTDSAPVGAAGPTPAPPAPGPPLSPGSPYQSSSCPDFPPHPSFLEPWPGSSWPPCSSQQRLRFRPGGTAGFRSLCPYGDTAPTAAFGQGGWGGCPPLSCPH